jgi:hypothetical protein
MPRRQPERLLSILPVGHAQQAPERSNRIVRTARAGKGRFKNKKKRRLFAAFLFYRSPIAQGEIYNP